MRVPIVGLLALAIVSKAAGAQTARSEAIPVASLQTGSVIRVHSATGPTIEAAAVGIRPAPSSVAAASNQSNAPRRRSQVNHDVALMVVGVGAMIAGSFIKGTAGTVFVVGGALIALYGLYNFLE
jgi:hypothetical protein